MGQVAMERGVADRNAHPQGEVMVPKADGMLAVRLTHGGGPVTAADTLWDWKPASSAAPAHRLGI